MNRRVHKSHVMNPLLVITAIFSVIVMTQSAPTTPQSHPATPPARKTWSTKLSQFVEFTFKGFEKVTAKLKELEETKATQLKDHERLEEVVNVLKKYGNANITAIFGLTPKCEIGWEMFEERCYNMTRCTSTTNTAVTAQAECEKHGANLAQIRSQAHNQWLAKGVKAMSRRFTYIGGSDEEVEGVWRWKDGTLIKDGYTRWHSSQGKSGGRGENCLLLYQDTDWHDWGCTATRTDSAFTCEKNVYY